MKARSSIQVEMLPAGHGDALLVHYRAGAGMARMLIDGGPSFSYVSLLDRLLALPADQRRFELLVVTHIDGDHIDGIVRLLQEDLDGLGISFDDVWFNGTDQMDQVLAAEDSLGATQGEYLQALIKHLGLPWNRAFGGGPIMASPNRPITLASGAKVRLLSPTRDKLLDLIGHWSTIIEGEGYHTGDTDEALARLAADRRLRALGGERDSLGGERLDRVDATSDRSKANGSSIAFTLEVGRQRILFGGDAHPDTLVRSLDTYLSPGSRLKLRAFKLPHHGSAANLSAALLDRLDCTDFLVSTNGKYFDHPDVAAIELLIQEVDAPHLWFNYAIPGTTRWLDPDYGEDAVVHLPSGLNYPQR
jgi:beta-lactamase superfamily II metal-dependent hydrolase